jgi:hypothetical protein
MNWTENFFEDKRENKTVRGSINQNRAYREKREGETVHLFSYPF